jgi:hypothetical protein
MATTYSFLILDGMALFMYRAGDRVIARYNTLSTVYSLILASLDVNNTEVMQVIREIGDDLDQLGQKYEKIWDSSGIDEVFDEGRNNFERDMRSIWNKLYIIADHYGLVEQTSIKEFYGTRRGAFGGQGGP